MMTKQVANFENGDLVRDNVTGLEGIVMVVAHYSTGCIHCGIQPQKVKEDGTVPDWSWLDQSRLSLVRIRAISFDVQEKHLSGPMPTGPQL